MQSFPLLFRQPLVLSGSFHSRRGRGDAEFFSQVFFLRTSVLSLEIIDKTTDAILQHFDVEVNE